MANLRQPRSRHWIWGAAFLVLAGGGLLLWSPKSRALFRELVGERQPSSRASSSDEPRARLARARAASREGRFDVAAELYRGLDERQMQAEDFFELGSVLLERKRIAMGWAALEAARRIDRSHVPTLKALDTLQTKLAMAQDRDRKEIDEAAARVEFLLSIPGGTPLGTLVLGLVRYAKYPDQEEEFLDRLMARDRGVLRGVDATSAALRLVARLLLETGRPLEARDLLQALSAAPGAGAGLSPPNDPGAAQRGEAAWLLSRAALQLDEHDTADAMLGLAGSFAKGATSSPEPAPFVGSRRCGDCHRTIYREQQGASRHALTLSVGSDLKNVPLPARPVPDPVVPSITHSFSRKGDGHIELETRAGDRLFGRLSATRWDRAATASRWSPATTRESIASCGFPTFPRHTHGARPRESMGHRAPAATTSDWNSRAGPCIVVSNVTRHGFGRSTPADRACEGPKAEDHGIGCERCHGPGLNHIKAIESGFADLAIAQTRATPILSRLKSCTECHASDGSVAASDPEFTRAQGTTLLFSACFTASKGQIGCTTCHDPHRVLDTSIPGYEAKCLGCHAASAPRRGAASRSVVAGQGGRPAAPSCPVNPTSNCIACHMPKVEDLSRRSRFTDHHIRVHRGPGSVHAFDGRR